MNRCLIVIPDARAWNHFSLTGMAWRIAKYGVDGWDFNLALLGGFSPVDAARNKAVDLLLTTECTHLWFWGTDNLFDNSMLWVLDDPERDICGGAYFTYQDNNDPGDALKIVGGPFERGAIPPREPFAGEYIGMDCAIIRRRVFEDPRMQLGEKRWFRTIYDGEWGRASVTEDSDFCQRARDAGYTIWVDPRPDVGHEKTLDLRRIVPLIDFQIGHALERKLNGSLEENPLPDPDADSAFPQPTP
jgi:hypothetical protein